jgi:hypothetical protein
MRPGERYGAREGTTGFRKLAQVLVQKERY